MSQKENQLKAQSIERIDNRNPGTKPLVVAETREYRTVKAVSKSTLYETDPRCFVIANRTPFFATQTSRRKSAVCKVGQYQLNVQRVKLLIGGNYE